MTDKNANVTVGVNNKTLAINISPGKWTEYRISLSCFETLGVDMAKIKTALMLTAKPGTEIGIADIRIEADTDGKPNCVSK